MSPVLILGLIVGVPALLILWLRINAALVFLSLCLGDVLVQFVANDANLMLSGVTSRATPSNVKLLLLLLPAVLTMFFMVKTVKKSRLALNALPALGAGFLAALLIVPLLSAATADPIIHSDVWKQVQKLQDLIVGVSALVSLFFLWLQRPKAGDKHDKKHGK
ncbi:MAG TPA: hypothetical protein VHD60_03000 [Candidatus Saccharimonadales bacterium]|nr:hypothetical protein [Candidatus Saccharimonadales bacterium]